jgi:hypothetical protein
MTSQLVGRNAQVAIVVDNDLEAIVWTDGRTAHRPQISGDVAITRIWGLA